MQSLATLNTLLQQAEVERDTAQAAAHQFDTAATQAEAQAQQLTEYRTQYQQRWSTQFRQSGAIELVQCYQGFSQRLEQAIELQTRAAQKMRERAEQARLYLVACEQRVAAVRKLIERRQAEHRRTAERREQRATDEVAQRAHQGSSRLSPSLI